MQCSNCQKDAIFRVDWKDKEYCPDHFKRYFLGQVAKVIDKYEMGGRVCVALSGGKDSSACVEALTHFDEVEVEPLHINLGIGEYSKESLEHCKKICDELGLDLNVLDLEKEYGTTIPELNEREGGKACGICGMVKRYLMNKFSYENNFDYVATGHNLSDEVSSTFNNLANVYLTPFRGMEPILEEKEDYRMVARAKPLFYLKDEECRVYTETYDIPFYSEGCPLSKDTPTHELKDWLHELDSKRPRIMRNFAKSFMRIEEMMETGQEDNLRNCENCGYATATNVCRFCRVVGNG